MPVYPIDMLSGPSGVVASVKAAFNDAGVLGTVYQEDARFLIFDTTILPDGAVVWVDCTSGSARIGQTYTGTDTVTFPATLTGGTQYLNFWIVISESYFMFVYGGWHTSLLIPAYAYGIAAQYDGIPHTVMFSFSVVNDYTNSAKFGLGNTSAFLMATGKGGLYDAASGCWMKYVPYFLEGTFTSGYGPESQAYSDPGELKDIEFLTMNTIQLPKAPFFPYGTTDLIVPFTMTETLLGGNTTLLPSGALRLKNAL